MNQHLPPSNIKPVDWQPEDFKARPAVTEQFFVLRGKKEQWIDGDLVDRATVIDDIDSHYSNLRQVIAISLAAGTCRDATDEICKIVIERWSQDDEELSREAYEFVEMVCGTTFANAFRREEV